ncbi:hypothetical protein AOQ71_04830 [Bradyrhizobium manausense]|uniref:Uncharacterized protein n=2 Tax=Bradyrhizobium manausense TaxID=989370 RepID=A0A0R3E8W7_9BRAD|nr:hypothetical protein AOQ71_04830 [Bradyrhizobium manausense]
MFTPAKLLLDRVEEDARGRISVPELTRPFQEAPRNQERLSHVALGFLIGRVSLDVAVTTVSSCLRIWLETVRDQPVPTFPMYT